MLPLKDYIKEFNLALDLEIKYQKETGGRLYIIQDGMLLDNHENFIYRFVIDDEVSLPDGTPVRVKIGEKEFTGHVISLEGFDLILAMDQYLGAQVQEAHLFCEPWGLLEALQKRLEEIDKRNISLAVAVLNGTPVRINNSKPVA